MKISFSGSRSGRPLSHAWRASFTSGRSCSAACVVFFARDPPTLEEAPDRPDPEPLPPLFLQLRLEFLERDVGGLLDGPEDELRFFLDAIRPAIAALLVRSDRPRRFLPLGPADRARNAHPPQTVRPPAGATALAQSRQPHAAEDLQRAHEPCLLASLTSMPLQSQAWSVGKPPTQFVRKML